MIEISFFELAFLVYIAFARASGCWADSLRLSVVAAAAGVAVEVAVFMPWNGFVGSEATLEPLSELDGAVLEAIETGTAIPLTVAPICPGNASVDIVFEAPIAGDPDDFKIPAPPNIFPTKSDDDGGRVFELLLIDEG